MHELRAIQFVKNQIYEDSSGASLEELGNGILFIYKVARIFLLATTGIHRLLTSADKQ